MIKEATNKDAGDATEQYFFSGGTEYEPVTVMAKDSKEAEEIWLKIRKKVDQK